MTPKSSEAGYALIFGAFLLLVTMALHPAGHDLLTPGAAGERMASLATVVHAIGIASIPISLFGFFGLTRRLQAAAPSRSWRSSCTRSARPRSCARPSRAD